jgi:hypothetical protein
MTKELPRLDRLASAVAGEKASAELDRIGAAVTIAAELGSLGDQLVTHFVAAAREAGCSWSQIGEQLGVSKQAAQQGFVAPAHPGRFGRLRPARMTDQARAAVANAEEQARALNHTHLGTEHLLLALAGQQTGLAAQTLRQFGIGVDAVLAKVREKTGGDAVGPVPRRISFAPRTKKVLELALRESLALKQRGIGPEHILLGILREGEGPAAQIMVELGADLRQLRRAVTDALP